MGDSQDEGLSFELLAASIRADAADLRTFLEVLAGKLEGALPGEVEVKRKGGLFQSKKEVESLAVSLDDLRFVLNKQGSRLEPAIRREVRGVTLKTEPVTLEVWIERLAQKLHEHAASSAKAREALGRFIQ